MTDLDMLLAESRSAMRYLDQGEVWFPKPPREPVRIADMDPEWRYNSARLLLRNAEAHAFRYGLGEIAFLMGPLGPSGDAACDAVDAALDESDRFRMSDPQGWMRTRPLYRALVAGLPGNPSKLYRLAQRARHWGTCEARRRNSALCTCRPTEPPAGPVRLRDDVPILIVGGPARPATDDGTGPAPAVGDWGGSQDSMRWTPPDDETDLVLDDEPAFPDPEQPWIDRDGFDHREGFHMSEHCPFDSCRACGGYHCGWHCPDLHREEDEFE